MLIAPFRSICALFCFFFAVTFYIASYIYAIRANAVTYPFGFPIMYVLYIVYIDETPLSVEVEVILERRNVM